MTTRKQITDRHSIYYGSVWISQDCGCWEVTKYRSPEILDGCECQEHYLERLAAHEAAVRSREEQL